MKKREVIVWVAFFLVGVALLGGLMFLGCKCKKTLLVKKPFKLVYLPSTSDLNTWFNTVRMFENKGQIPVINISSMMKSTPSQITVIQNRARNSLTKQYCDKYNYNFMELDDSVTASISWLYLFHMLKSSPLNSYFCFITSPNVVLHPDSNKPLQRLIDQSGDSSLMLCRDKQNNSLFGLDIFLFRNTEWSQFKCVQLYMSLADKIQMVLRDQVYTAYQHKTNSTLFNLGMPYSMQCVTVFHEKAFDFSTNNASVYPWTSIPGFVEIPKLLLPRWSTTSFTQLIPKIIYQTMSTTLASQDRYTLSTKAWQDLNPDYKYMFFDSKDCREFIENHFDDRVIQAYNMLLCGAYQSDLWRLCVLYVQGGCYVDSQTQPLVPLSHMIDSDTEFLSADDGDAHGIWQGFLCVTPKHPAIFIAIQECTNNILSKTYFKLSLSLTGPDLMRKCLNQYLGRPQLMSFTTFPPPSHVKLLSFIPKSRPYLTNDSVPFILSKYHYNTKQLTMPYISIYDITGKEDYTRAHQNKRVFTFPLFSEI